MRIHVRFMSYKLFFFKGIIYIIYNDTIV